MPLLDTVLVVKGFSRLRARLGGQGTARLDLRSRLPPAFLSANLQIGLSCVGPTPSAILQQVKQNNNKEPKRRERLLIPSLEPMNVGNGDVRTFIAIDPLKFVKERMRKIFFADLTHTGRGVDANTFPLGAAYLASTTQASFGSEYALRIFKYPSVLTDYLNREAPDVLALSSYMWNERISLAYAAKAKARNPALITIFGGPNYPIDLVEQEAWLRVRPQIDFHIDGEGELAFVELLRALREVQFDASAMKDALRVLPSVHYISGKHFVHGPLLPRIMELDESIPSPYLMGLMDAFFDDKLRPLVQTTRGCPYSCTFCHDGIIYANKTRRFSRARIDGELEYVFARAKVPDLVLADLNFGMFPEDIDTAKTLARMRTQRQWPMTISVAAAKMQKKRVVELAGILGDSWPVGASIQSSDATVLKNIKRTNIGVDAIVEMTKGSRLHQARSYTEIILGLPGDTREKHFKSVFDMFDANIDDMSCYQFILLPGTEAASDLSRVKYQYETRFRVLPRCFGRYEIYGHATEIAEVHEVCVANATMPYHDYQDCRWFDLSLAIKNGGVYEEFLTLVELLGGRRASVFDKIHSLSIEPGSSLRVLYDDFRKDEERSFWRKRDQLLSFLDSSEGFDAYLSGKFGLNEIFKYRALALFRDLEAVLDIVVKATRAEIANYITVDGQIDSYLGQLRQVVLARRSALTDVERSFKLQVNFDFFALDRSRWAIDPRSVWGADSRQLVIEHSADRRKVVDSYLRQYGKSFEDLMYLIHRSSPHMLYREIRGLSA